MATALKESDSSQEGQVETWITEAVNARHLYEAAGKDYADYVTRESELEADRHLVKQEAVLRYMADGKTSATAAEKLAVIDSQYTYHLKLQREVVALKNDACTRMHSAKLRAELAIAAIKSIAGMV